MGPILPSPSPPPLPLRAGSRAGPQRAGSGRTARHARPAGAPRPAIDRSRRWQARSIGGRSGSARRRSDLGRCDLRSARGGDPRDAPRSARAARSSARRRPFGSSMMRDDGPLGRQEPPGAAQARDLMRKLQAILDRTSPHPTYRWLGWVFLTFVFIVRVARTGGFYIVAYALGIYELNLLLGFLSPQVDPELDGPTLPRKNDEEFRPFVRKLPEFKFWLHASRATALSAVATLVPAFDVPVFWPILVLYFIVLFTVTMKRQIQHMIKYRYLPFTTGKKTYGGKSKRGSAP